MNNATKMQFMKRVSSFSTVASKRGINLLGWEIPEKLTDQQYHDCLKDRIKYLTPMFSDKKMTKDQRKLLSSHFNDINKEINKIRKIPQTMPKEFNDLLLDIIKDDIPDFKWREYIRRAKVKYDFDKFKKQD